MRLTALFVELRVPSAGSLKAKRAVVQSVVRTLDGWKGVAAAETAYQDKWQRAGIGIVIVSGSVHQMNSVAESVERYLWSRPDAEIVRLDREWVDHDLGGV